MKPEPAADRPTPELDASAKQGSPDTAVVGIGASAGGLEAFSELLRHLPPDTGMAFVLVQHLDPDHKSVLAELLARKTSMPVLEATDGLALAPDSLYVIPATKDVTLAGGRLRLEARPSSGAHLPIDLFFTSLARDRTSKAIAVVLSGTASDGAQGIQAIKAEGGVTLAQDPATARYPSMPESAIATGAVDFVLSIPLLAQQLAAISHHPDASRYTPEEVFPLVSPDDPLLGDLLALVRVATAADFTHYKQSTVLRRISRRISFRRMDNLEQYVELLRSDRSEVEALFQDLLIRVTSFFRQPQVFETLKEEFFPQIASARGGERVRFWVPGCSTGEEAYSLAIAWAEFLDGSQPGKASLQVFASDINQQVIDKARTGIYPQSITEDVSQERLSHFFQRVKGGYQITKEVRETCVFAKHDLSRDPPFSRIDLISLRNVLIYLGPTLQRRIMPLLHFALRPEGFLLLGDSESIGGFTDLFSAAHKKVRIYARRDRPVSVVPPIPPPARHSRGTVRAFPAAEFDFSKEAERILLEDYTPVGVVVDADLTVRQLRGRLGAYLELRPGRASLDLLDLAHKGLALELGNALREAKRLGLPVHRNNVRILRDKSVVAVGFHVVPMQSPVGEMSFLVLFHDTPPAGSAQPAAEILHSPEDSGDAARNGDLELQMSELREYARAALEDKESANEELRSANEELQSTNEELQSTNEELQSVNEELEASSEEVQSANEELRTLNDELQSVNDRLEMANKERSEQNAELEKLNAALQRDRGFDEVLAELASSSSLQLNEDVVLRSVLGEALDALAADSARFLEPGPKGWTLRYAAGDIPRDAGAHAKGLSPRLLERLERDKAPFVAKQREAESKDPVDLLVIPLLRSGQLVGVLELSYNELPTLTEAHYQFARRLSFVVSLALQNARLYEAQRGIAERMQHVLLDVPQETSRVKFAHLYRSETDEAFIGGDFYDVFHAKEGRIAVLIGDVSGHGVEAARVAALTKDVVHAFAHQFGHPSLVLRKTNELLNEKSVPGFVTLFLGILDPEGDVIDYSSAGHPNVLLRKRNGEINVLAAGSAPLAAYPSHSWTEDHARFEPGDLLLLYTDGLTEARRDGEFFGLERLVESLRRWPKKSVDGLPEALLEEVLSFSGKILTDDVALLAVERREESGG
jgi:chemotaxis methyl-accepting protein methylase/serine phosphatase RsbU (regulator of sigma subunit)